MCFRLRLTTTSHATLPLHPQELVKARAVEGLLALVQEPLAQQQRERGGGDAASPSGDGQSPLKIALFSLGNLSAHQECRERLLGARPAQMMRPVIPTRRRTTFFPARS